MWGLSEGGWDREGDGQREGIGYGKRAGRRGEGRMWTEKRTAGTEGGRGGIFNTEGHRL